MYKKLRMLIFGEQLDYKTIGKKIGHSAKYVCERMTGKKSWTMDDVYILCDLLDIPVEEIYVYFPKGGKVA